MFRSRLRSYELRIWISTGITFIRSRIFSKVDVTGDHSFTKNRIKIHLSTPLQDSAISKKSAVFHVLFKYVVDQPFAEVREYCFWNDIHVERRSRTEIHCLFAERPMLTDLLFKPRIIVLRQQLLLGLEVLLGVFCHDGQKI